MMPTASGLGEGLALGQLQPKAIELRRFRQGLRLMRTRHARRSRTRTTPIEAGRNRPAGEHSHPGTRNAERNRPGQDRCDE
jgi:hypothetical protein